MKPALTQVPGRVRDEAASGLPIDRLDDPSAMPN